MLFDADTIVAPATPPGRGGVAIVRISGNKVPDIIAKIVNKPLVPRVATLTPFFAAAEHIIDQGIALFFPGPNSFTGEDILELHGHGGPAVVNMLVQQIINYGARLARPGEFSERAFLNGKMDLVQAEAVADLINAASEQAARSAMRSLQGEFSAKIQALVSQLIQLRTYIEAAIDFSDEEIDFLALPEIKNKLQQLLASLTQLQASAKQGSLLRDGINVVIAGVPNVGKSSLLNALSGKEAAIVTAIAGTTRDVVREYITIDGLPLHIIDTAGLRASSDEVEQEGIRRAYDEIAKADLILHVVDHDELPDVAHLPQGVPRIVIRNKIDLIKGQPDVVHHPAGFTKIALSAKSGVGLALLKDTIKTQVGFQQTNEGVFLARQRHLTALASAHAALIRADELLATAAGGELVAEELRQAQLALNEITGEFTADDLLGQIFASFCVGK